MSTEEKDRETAEYYKPLEVDRSEIEASLMETRPLVELLQERLNKVRQSILEDALRLSRELFDDNHIDQFLQSEANKEK